MGGLAMDGEGDILDPSDVTRARGIARSAHAQMGLHLFSQDPLSNVASIRTTTMGPTGGGHEVYISRQSRTLQNTLNVYRNFVVSGGALFFF
jgi:hypothetical protein